MPSKGFVGDAADDVDQGESKNRRDSSQFLVKLHHLLDEATMAKEGIEWNQAGDGKKTLLRVTEF